MLDFPAEMRRAVDRHMNGQLAEAEILYRKILAEIPAQFDAVHNLGVLLIQRGRNDEALDFLRRACTINPQSASACLNVGNALRNLGRSEEALQSYDRALAINPNYAEAHNNRGVMLRRAGDFAGALESYDRAVLLKPAYAEAHNNRATVLREDLKRNQEALVAAEQALALAPKDPDAHLNRAHALAALKREDEAIASYRRALSCGGDAEMLSYYLSALGAGETPATSPPRYVESLFDQYAGRFDHSLASLKYAVPEQLFNMVVEITNPVQRSLDIVDLGCGTGLCGPLFRPIARSLTGVDLSAGMLEKASERGLYDSLAKADMIDFLDACPASFDLAIATDVFIYVGALEKSFAAVATALRPGAHFAFSVEAYDGDGFVIRPSRRFAHSVPYLERLAEKNGFRIDGIIPVAVRLEEGQDIPGHIAVMTLN
jgi:predicted TPR repeat methyltransferase